MIAAIAIILIVVTTGLLRLLPLGRAETTGVPRIVFAVFGQTADLIYIAPATDPDDRTIVDTVEHAEGWGMNPGLMSGTLLVYNVTPLGTSGQRRAPAELWLLNITTRTKTRLARDADLLVKPQFVAGGTAVLYRRSDGELQSLVRVDLETLTRTVVYEERTAFGIFPVGYDISNGLLFARLSVSGTDVFVRHDDSEPTAVFHASDEIARDWQISPDRRSVAYLAPQTRAERVVYRAHVVSIATGSALPLPKADANGEQYGPTWTPGGATLAVGQEPTAAISAPIVLLRPGATPIALPVPARGFDVPVAWSEGGAYLAARTFDGPNSAAPGRESAVVISMDGKRYPLSAPGEVILVGWLPNA